MQEHSIVKAKHQVGPLEIPFDEVAERTVLGVLLNENMSGTPAYRKLTPGHFYGRKYEKIFSAIVPVLEKGLESDDYAVISQLRMNGDLVAAGGSALVCELSYNFHGASNFDHHVNLLHNLYRLRQLNSLSAALGMQTTVPNANAGQVMQEAEETLLKLRDGGDAQSVVLVRDCLKTWLSETEKNYNEPGRGAGLTFGLRDLDRTTNGMKGGQFIVMAGRPGMGKTTLALNVAQRAAVASGKAVLIFSLEMGRIELINRMVASEAKVNSRKFANEPDNRMDASDFGRVIPALDKLKKTTIGIAEPDINTMSAIRAQVRRWKNEIPLCLVIVDYLQRVTPRVDSMPQEQQVKEVSHALKGMALECDLPVIGVSQLNRGTESRSEKRPVMSDLRGSGAIEQDADMILFVYREEEYNAGADASGVSEIIVAKNRSGKKGTIEVKFQPEFTRFDDLSFREMGNQK